MQSTRDIAPLVKSIADVVKGHVAAAFAPLAERIKALEAREPVKGEPGEKGLDGTNGIDGKDGVDGKDGSSITIEDVQPLIKQLVDKAFADMPAPKDGIDGVDGADGKDGIDGANGKDGEKGLDGKDGRDGIDGKSVTLDDLRPLLESEVSKWALEFERRAQDTLQRAIDRIPIPKDGINGKDGRDGIDGLGFDDLEIEHDGERGITFVMRKDEREKVTRFRLPLLIDRGVYDSDKQYEMNDGVTYSGSYWVSRKDQPTVAPGADPEQWRLCVKKGRDGRNGKDGEKGDQGLPGRPAR